MGKPKNVEPAKVSENYDWGVFGGANPAGVNLSGQASQNVASAQRGVGQYLNELLNPSYNNASFRAREDLINQNNLQYARDLGAQALARGARGSATQQILNSIAANRNTNLRQAMTEEDARVRNILNTALGTENMYFGQANTMADNILRRVLSNQANQQRANEINTQARNEWQNNLLNAGMGVAGALTGGGFASLFPETFGYLINNEGA